MGFLRRLFGLGEGVAPKKITRDETVFTHGGPNRDASVRYFDLMGKMQLAAANLRYDEAAQIILQTLKVVEPWLQENLNEYGSFDIRSIPVFDQGGRILAYLSRDSALAEMDQIIQRHAEFEPWRDTVAEHRADTARFARILEIVEETPGTLQTDMKKLLGEEDGRRVATLIASTRTRAFSAPTRAARTPSRSSSEFAASATSRRRR